MEESLSSISRDQAPASDPDGPQLVFGDEVVGGASAYAVGFAELPHGVSTGSDDDVRFQGTLLE
jgi:hypothetical protein